MENGGVKLLHWILTPQTNLLSVCVRVRSIEAVTLLLLNVRMWVCVREMTGSLLPQQSYKGPPCATPTGDTAVGRPPLAPLDQQSLHGAPWVGHKCAEILMPSALGRSGEHLLLPEHLDLWPPIGHSPCPRTHHWYGHFPCVPCRGHDLEVLP